MKRKGENIRRGDDEGTSTSHKRKKRKPMSKKNTRNYMGEYESARKFLNNANRNFADQENFTSFKFIRERMFQTKPAEFADSYNKSMTDLTESINEDEEILKKRAAKDLQRRKRTDKKRQKRKCDDSEPIETMPLNLEKTEPDFAVRKSDIGFIGNVHPSEIQKDDEGFLLTNNDNEQCNKVAKPQSESISDSLPLMLQRYYIHSKTTPRKDIASTSLPVPSAPASDHLNNHRLSHSNLSNRHMQTTCGESARFSFIQNELMKQRVCNIPIDRLPMFDTVFANVVDRLREEEECMLREHLPSLGERPCANDNTCEAMHLLVGIDKFPLVEYQPPEVIQKFKETRKWPEKRSVCIMCQRYRASATVINIDSRCSASEVSSVEMEIAIKNSNFNEVKNKPLVVASFGNIVGDGEYSPWDVYMSNFSYYNGLSKPVVRHTLYMYNLYKKDGIRYYRQNLHKPRRDLRYGGGLDFDDRMLATIMEELNEQPTQTVP